MYSAPQTHLEEVKEGARVDTRLLVSAGEERILGLLVRDERREELELEPLGNVVLELDVGAEDVGGAPRLGEGEAVLPVLELGLEVADDDARLGVAVAEDLEGDAVGRLGLDLEGRAVDGAVQPREAGRKRRKVGHGQQQFLSFNVRLLFLAPSLSLRFLPADIPCPCLLGPCPPFLPTVDAH